MTGSPYRVPPSTQPPEPKPPVARSDDDALPEPWGADQENGHVWTDSRHPGPLARPLVVGVSVGLACLALWMVFAPSTGSIVVNVMAPHGAAVHRIDVLVDGKKTPCEMAPCVLVEGSGEHEVKVVADGYEAPAPQAVVVRSRKPVAATFVVRKGD